MRGFARTFPDSPQLEMVGLVVGVGNKTKLTEARKSRKITSNEMGGQEWPWAGKFRLIDLSSPVTERVPEPDPPRIKRISHRQGGNLLGLGVALMEGEGIWQKARNLIAWLLGLEGIRAKDFPDGLGLALEEVKSDLHAGTHLDAPWHFGPTSAGRPAKKIGEVALEWCFGEAMVLDLRHLGAGEEITPSHLEAALEAIAGEIAPGKIVLLMTGADRYWGQEEYLWKYPGMGREGTLWLLERGVKVIGIDAFGFDRPWPTMAKEYLATRDAGKLWPAHLVGREREYCHIEKMANLHRIPRPKDFQLACFPINVEGAGAGWVRPVAIVPWEA